MMARRAAIDVRVSAIPAHPPSLLCGRTAIPHLHQNARRPDILPDSGHDGGTIFITMNPETLGARLRARRRGLGLDQAVLAELAGVSAHTLSNLESGRSNPTLAVLLRVFTALGLELDLRIATPLPPEGGSP